MSDRRASGLACLSVLALVVYGWLFYMFPYENICFLFTLCGLAISAIVWFFFFNLWKGNA